MVSTERLAPWSRPVNILAPDAEEQLRRNGAESRLLHENGYWKWDANAERFLALAKWGIVGGWLAKSIENINKLGQE